MRSALLGLSLLIFGLDASYAAEPAALTVEMAVEMALSQNPEVQTLGSEIEAARARVLIAGSLGAPDVSFGFTDKLRGPIDDPQEITLGVEQEIPFPGKRRLRRDAATFELRSLEAEARGLERRLTAVVREQYYLAKFHAERIANLTSSERLLTEFGETTRNRFEGGQAPYLDVIRAKIELSRLRNELLEARREGQLAKADLNLLLGRTGATSIDLTTPLAVPAVIPERQGAIDRAVAESASLEAQTQTVEAARAARKLAGKSHLPDPGLEFSLERLRADGTSTDRWGTGVRLRVPLWWWKEPRGLVGEAEANRVREEVRLVAKSRAVRTEAEQAVEAADAAEAQVRVFESSILDDLESELRAGIGAYQTGQIDALNLIDIYRTYIESHTEYSRTLYLYLAALARVEAAGDLEP